MCHKLNLNSPLGNSISHTTLQIKATHSAIIPAAGVKACPHRSALPVYSTLFTKIFFKNMCYIFHLSVNVLNKKTNKQKSIKIKEFFWLVCFFSYMGIKTLFFSCTESTENSWRMWCLNPPFCSHTEILWHELSDVSSWNEAVPECQHWSMTRCMWDTSW